MSLDTGTSTRKTSGLQPGVEVSTATMSSRQKPLGAMQKDLVKLSESPQSSEVRPATRISLELSGFVSSFDFRLWREKNPSDGVCWSILPYLPCFYVNKVSLFLRHPVLWEIVGMTTSLRWPWGVGCFHALGCDWSVGIGCLYGTGPWWPVDRQGWVGKWSVCLYYPYICLWAKVKIIVVYVKKEKLDGNVCFFGFSLENDGGLPKTTPLKQISVCILW